MNKSNFKSNNILKIISNSIISLPTPVNISIWWNMGSMLGLCLMIQIISGLFLSMHYCANTLLSFNSMIHIIQNVNMGWLFRLIHMNGASMFFFIMYMHIGRGIYYGSFKLKMTWFMGIMLFLISMMTAFMGYVLPWGQMSFWGATVITNLISTIPYIGGSMVMWIWGGFSVDNSTLNRFLTFHFITPFLILALMILHLMFLHNTGSNNPMGINSNYYKIPFHIYFTLKDMCGFIILIMMILILSLMNPFLLSDPENFIPANPMLTPPHIQPEWYFLFAYSILRSIPNKLGGVIALMMSIFILMFLMIPLNNISMNMKFYPINQIMFWMFVNIFILLTWLGAQPIETPFNVISQFLTIMYFLFYLLNSIMMIMWDKIYYN